MEIKEKDIVLCKFYFSDAKKFKNRPVLVFKDNLPHDDFVGIPISSKINTMYSDEYLINNTHFIEGKIAYESKLMIRKTFVISKVSVVKKYATLTDEAYNKYHNYFCSYFGCTDLESK